MNYSAIFKFVVKVFGVFLLCQTVNRFADYLADLAGSGQVITPLLFKVVVLAAGSIWFLLGAPPSQHFAYPESKPVIASEDKPEEQGKPCVSCDKPIPWGAKICPFCRYTQPV
ncbi:MAG TPA: hypothetical protein VFV23_09220 [Verrucomicrobiae bacterium]|nr:hypothetical protein [Verrucomicrobiae bacterium]